MAATTGGLLIDPDSLSYTLKFPNSSMTWAGGTVTVKSATASFTIANGFSNSAKIHIGGADVEEFDGNHTITRVSDSEFTYALADPGNSTSVAGYSYPGTKELLVDQIRKTVKLIRVGNLTADGVTLKCIYSKLKEIWKTDTTLIKYPFPMIPITDEQFEFVNGWAVENRFSSVTEKSVASCSGNVANITAASWATGVITFTAAGHGLATGHTTTVAGVTPTAYNGSYVVTGVTGNDFTVAKATDPGTYTSGGTSATQTITSSNNFATAGVLNGMYIGYNITGMPPNTGGTSGQEGAKVTAVNGTAFTMDKPITSSISSVTLKFWSKNDHSYNLIRTGGWAWKSEDGTITKEEWMNVTTLGNLGSQGSTLTLTSFATTNSSTTATCTSTAGLVAGSYVTGPYIDEGTTVSSITNATTFVLSRAATGTASGGIATVRPKDQVYYQLGSSTSSAKVFALTGAVNQALRTKQYSTTFTANTSAATVATTAVVFVGYTIGIGELTVVTGADVKLTHVGHNMVTGDKFTVSGVTPAAYNGYWTVTSVSGNDVFFTVASAPGGANTTTGSWDANKNKVTTGTAHGLTTGWYTEIKSVTPVAYNGVFKVQVIDTTNFFYTMPYDLGAATVQGTASTAPTLQGVSSTTGLYAGLGISGTGISSETMVAEVISSTVVAMTKAATATNTGTTITTGYDSSTSNSVTKVFVREYAYTYSVATKEQIGVTVPTYKVYAFPLSNQADLNITHDDSTVSANTPYTNTTITYLRNSVGTQYVIKGDYDTGSVSYAITDVVKDTGNNRWYKCILAYTSGATQPSSDATHWTVYEGERLIGSTYAAFNVIIDADITVAGFTLGIGELTVVTGADVKITHTSHAMTTGDKFTVEGVTPAAYNGYWTVTSVSGNDVFFTVASAPAGASTTTGTLRNITDYNSYGSASRAQVYEKVQYLLRQSSDIDSSAGSITGQTANALLTFVGPTLITSNGVYIDNFGANDTNDIEFYDGTGTKRTFPYVATLTLNFGENLQTDSNAKYWVFFTNANGSQFGTSDAIIVQTNEATDMTGNVAAASSVTLTFNYDGNTQGGRTAGTNAAVTAVAIGLEKGQYVKTTGTIEKSKSNSVSLVSSLERNYANIGGIGG